MTSPRSLTHIEQLMLHHVIAEPDRFQVSKDELAACQRAVEALGPGGPINPADLQKIKALIKKHAFPLRD